MLRGNTFFSNYELDEIFKSAKNIFFIGIGGVSMSSLAEYCYFNGKTVFGYDRERGENARRLERICNIKYYSTPDNVSSMDMVVYSTSIDTSNFEMQRAQKLGIPLVSRANFLGYVMSKSKNRIGICGTHGKSTVTSMVAHVFEYACKNPTVFCGAVMKEFCSTSKLGKGEDFIFEACEYQNAFHNFCPTHVIVTNIEYDHPDFFENEEEVFSSFQKFARMSDVVLVNLDDARASRINHERRITFGINKNAEYTASDVRVEKGRTLFSVYYHGAKICECSMAFFGIHMVYNALSAIAFCHFYGINSTIIEMAISSYTGVKRRAELIMRMRDKDVYLDYAHHPTEIRASLDGFRCMGYNKILVIFQAHTYSRTIALYDKFVSSLKMADELAIAPIYEAREINESEYSDKTLASDTGAEYIDRYEAICEKISKSDSDCVVIMGAGDIEKIKKFLK